MRQQETPKLVARDAPVAFAKKIDIASSDASMLPSKRVREVTRRAEIDDVLSGHPEQLRRLASAEELFTIWVNERVGKLSSHVKHSRP